MAEFTHLDSEGNARMVDVSDKDASERTATAKGGQRTSSRGSRDAPASRQSALLAE